MAIAFVVAITFGCSGASSPSGFKENEVEPLVVSQEPPADAGVGISEVQARRELDALFRDAGFRILNDELLPDSPIEVVLDGYDPEQRIGYEYIDASEAAQSLARSEQEKASGDVRVLVLDACSLDELRRTASSFLSAATTADASSLD